MADQIKDIALKIAATVSGQEQVVALATQLDKLAKEGGAAAPEFEKLAEQLRKLGEQGGAVTALGQLQSEVDATAASLKEARGRVTDLGVALQEQTQKTQTFREQQVAAKAALEQTAAQIRDVQRELLPLKASTDEAGKNTAAYKQQVRDLTTQLASLKVTQADQKAELKSVNEALRQAETELSKSTKSYDTAQSSVIKLNKTLTEQAASLDQTRVAMTKTGVAATEFEQASVEVAQAMEKLRQESVQLIAKNEQAAQTTRALAEAERKLQAELQFELETAERLVKAEQEQTLASEKLAQVKREEAQAQQAAAQAAQNALNQALGVIGVKSARELEAEIAKVRAALITVRESGQVTGSALAAATSAAASKVQGLEKELRAVNGELTALDKAKNVFGSIGAQVGIGVTGVQLFSQAVVKATSEFFGANKSLESLNLGLTSVYGSSKVAADQITFLKDAANKAGVSVGDISASFVKYAASAQAANIPIETTNGLFAALTKSAATLGLSGEKVADMLNALGQIASKGVVQMEELRGQLGDALPGALPKVAKGLGITTAEMEHLSKTGQLMAQDVFPALRRVLEETQGDVSTMTAIWSRFKNTFTEISQEIGDSGVWIALKTSLLAVSEVVAVVWHGFQALSDGVVTTFRVVGLAVNGMLTLNKERMAEAGKLIDDFVNRQADRGRKLQEQDERNAKSFEAMISGEQKVAQASATAAKQFVVVGDAITLVETATSKATTAQNANAEAQNRMATATQAANQATQTSEVTWTKLSTAYGNVVTLVDQQVKLAHEVVAAKKAEGETLVALARASGDEASSLLASSSAAEANAKALTALSEKQATQLDVLKAELDAKVALANQTQRTDAATQEQLQTLRNTISVKEQEVIKAKEAAEASRIEAAARNATTQAYKDNSAKLTELRQAYTEAVSAADSLRAKQAEGKATAEEVTAAQTRVAQAQYLLRDATNDAIAAAERQKTTAAFFNSVMGDTKQGLDLAAAAAKNYSEKIALIAEGYARDAALDKGRLDAIRAEIALRGDQTGALAEQAKRLSESVALKEAEADKARQAAQGARDEAASRRIAAETYKDNSNRLYELKGAYIAAADAAAKLRAQSDNSKEGSDKLAEADRRAAEAAKLYSDALQDQANKLAESARAKQAQFSLEEAGIKLAIEQMRTVEEVARARGDEKAAIEAGNKIKELEIELLRLQAQAQRAEAEAVLAGLPAKRAQLELEGKLTEAMKKSLEAEELAAKAKLKQAEITDEMANRLGRVKQATDQATQSARDSAGGFDSMSDSMDKASSSADRLSNNLQRIKSYNGTSYGEGEAPVMGADGKPIQGVVQRTVMGGDIDAISNLRQRRDLGLLSTSDKGAAEAAYQAATANLQMFQGMNQAFISQGALNEALARVRDSKQILDRIRSMEGSSATGGAAAGGLNGGGSTTHNVNITLGGQTTTIGTASASDSAALTGVLKQLETAAARAA